LGNREEQVENRVSGTEDKVEEFVQTVIINNANMNGKSMGSGTP
jgi:hypothetical protein